MLKNSDVQHSLAVRFSRGDETALAEIYDRYSGPMFTTAMNLVGHRDMAAEAVQQAFFQAWRAASRFDPSKELQPWLYAITRRAAIDAYRRSKRSLSIMPLESVSDTTTALDPPSLDGIWRKWQVRNALDQLPSDEREVLRLAYFLGMSQSEISLHLAVPLGTVKSRSARAQRRLAALLTHLIDATFGQ